MPPANTPQGQMSPEPPNSTYGRPLTPLSYLSSPAPDLASTLVTQTEADADDENLRFLRTPVELADSATPGIPYPQQLALLEAQNRRRVALARADDRARVASDRAANRPNYVGNAETQGRRDPQQRDRMMRVLSRLSRFSHEAARPNEGRQEEGDDASLGREQSTSTAPTSVSTTVQSLESEVAEMREFLDDLRNNPYLASESGSTLTRRQDRERDAVFTRNPSWQRTSAQTESSSSILSGLQRAEREVQALERRLDATQRRMEYTERHADDLRSMAIMHNARINASTTERMLRYIRSREQLGGGNDHEGQNHDSNLLSRWSRLSRGTGFTSSDADTAMTDASATPAEAPRSLSARGAEAFVTPHEPPDEWMRAFRELDSQPRTEHRSRSAKPPMLENAIVYLDQLRDCTSYDEALNVAIQIGFANKEFFAEKHDDFLMDVSRFPPSFRSSWLQPGVKFAGSQHTTLQAATSRSHVASSAPRTSDAAALVTSQMNSVAESLSDARARSTTKSHEQWPVKVTLHAVDLDTMILSGTMEAYDVPNHADLHAPPKGTSVTSPSSTAKSIPITTYLEGQILDLQTYSFITPQPPRNRRAPPPAEKVGISFPPTTPAIDAANWRRLPPFVDIKDDDEVARILLSRNRLAEVNERYIFMRWKERCFVHRRGDTCPQSPSARRRSVPARRVGEGQWSAGGTARYDLRGRVGTRPQPESTLLPEGMEYDPGMDYGSIARGGGLGLGEGDDTDTGHGLTISGFYYVSLDRETGAVTGLYWDPNTSPYQCLRLKGEEGGRRGAWAWRCIRAVWTAIFGEFENWSSATRNLSLLFSHIRVNVIL